jgi:hypothetical protein
MDPIDDGTHEAKLELALFITVFFLLSSLLFSYHSLSAVGDANNAQRRQRIPAGENCTGIREVAAWPNVHPAWQHVLGAGGPAEVPVALHFQLEIF